MTVKIVITKACNGVMVESTEIIGGKEKTTKYVMMSAEHATTAIAKMLDIDLKMTSAEWGRVTE